MKKWGYVQLFLDGKRVLEHRYVMELKLGRKLGTNEHVHHINGKRNDNRIENLKVMDRFDHWKLPRNGKDKVSLICFKCGKEFKRDYNQRPEVKGYKKAYCSIDCTHASISKRNTSSLVMRDYQFNSG